jgi:long-subunit acyl-CoA synthetase (AMP-forming)
LLGGGPAPLSILESCKQKGIPVYQTYGMTETSSQIVTLSPEYSIEKLGSAGKALFPSQLKIMADSREADIREIGEILVKGPNVTAGYVNRPEETSEVIQDGWLKTGDLGIIDKNGNIFIRGRNKNMILGPSGQNIYPEELEDKLNNLEGVIESIVVERDGKLVGLVYPDLTVAEKLGISADELMKQNIQKLNKVVPSFCHLSKIELMKEEFAKTPKNSIKRFMYK